MRWPKTRRGKRPLFTDRDAGCHAGARAGPDHRRKVLADLVESVGGNASSEQEALALLQTHTAKGLVWRITPGGDLFLTDDIDKPRPLAWPRRILGH